MATTLLVDPPAAPSSEQPPAPGAPDAPPTVAAPPASQRSCTNCGASMDTAQEWCLQCGVGAPDSLTKRTPSWRSTATVLGATAILAIGAGAAAYAALSKATATARRATATVAQAPAPTGATPVTPTTPPPATPRTATPKAAKSILPPGTIKPPKIPLTPTTTPKSSPTATQPTATTTPSTTTPKSGASEGTKTTTEQLPTPILLDTNAVTTYNPYNYPASRFGDPSLAIDGDTSTGWTARLDPTVAPKMAEGLVVDLKAAQKLSVLELVTSTPGVAVQVFGTKASVLPTSITDPAWIQLSPYQVEKTRHALLKLRESTKAFNFITLWISKAPASSIGTPQAPGLVSVNEIELLPTK